MNRLIERYIKANATQALQSHLLLSPTQSSEIVASLAPIEMVLLNRYLPDFQRLLIEACSLETFPNEEFNTLEESIYAIHFTHLSRVSFDESFQQYYEITFKNIIADHIKNIIHTLVSLNNQLGIHPQRAFSLIRATNDAIEQQNIIRYGADFAKVARKEIFRIASYREDTIPSTLYLPIIAHQFKLFDASIQAELLSTGFANSVLLAQTVMTSYLHMNAYEIATSLPQLPASAIATLESHVQICLDKAFVIIQHDNGRDNNTLSAAFRENYANALQASGIQFNQSTAVAKILFNYKFINSIINLPDVLAIDSEHSVPQHIIEKNSLELQKVYYSIINADLIPYHPHLQGLTQPEENVPNAPIPSRLEQSSTPATHSVMIPVTGTLVLALGLFSYAFGCCRKDKAATIHAMTYDPDALESARSERKAKRH